MAEKVRIKSAVDSGRKYQDKPIINIELEDGRKGSSFSEEALQWSGEIELEIKEGKEYQGVMQHYFNKPNDGQGQKKGNFPMKDYTFDKRKASLDSAINTVPFLGVLKNNVDETEVIKIAEKYYEYLNKK